MDNLDRATTTRRTVANKAYQLLKDCKEPEAIFDGSWQTKEHWDVKAEQLEQEVAEELGWPEDEERFIAQVKFHVQNFLDSKEYEDLKDDVRERFYQYKRDQKDWNETKRGLLRA